MPRQSFTGRNPDHERRQEIITLRAQGYSLAAIGRRLHLSRQSIHEVLTRCAKLTVHLGAHCQACGVEITRRPELTSNNRLVLCLACLAQLPETTLGQRLKTYRVAAGLTQPELAEQIGVNMPTLASHEQDATAPAWPTLTKLIRVLGVGVVDLWNERTRGADSHSDG
jgi:DNA-binding XRE family transcriptional regulator